MADVERGVNGADEQHEADHDEDQVEASQTEAAPKLLKKCDSNFSSGFGSFRRQDKDRSFWATVLMAYQTLGVVYGDIGTSPLYTYPTVQLDTVEEKDFLGIFSIIFWTLTLISLIKYVFIVLRADDHGEGGTFALYSLLCQHANVGRNAGKQYARLESDTKLSFFAKNRRGSSKTKQFLEGSKTAQIILLTIVMIGTCMVIGDGVLTPAISVLSATIGLKSAVHSISQSIIILISCLILLALFLLQRFGTSKVSFMFSPIMILWFLSNGAIGIYNIAKNYPAVFKGLSPHYVFNFFLRKKKKGWTMLGAFVLCITGAEAMFADLGHFNKQSVQLAFTTLVYPSLVLTYAGQAAYLIKHPEDLADTFYKSIPHAVYWPMFVISTLAAIVASQALITATFSVLKQSMSLGCFPRIKLVYTSPKEEGQIYSPEVNYILMVLCLAVVLGFREGTQIGNAYGIAVIWVMLITTCLVTVVMLVVWRLPTIWALLFLVFFGFIEGVYLTSVLSKIVQGGWVPFSIAAVFLIISLSWNYGRQKKYQFESSHRVSANELANSMSVLNVRRVPGLCLFYSNLVSGLPPIMLHYIKATRSLQEVVIYLTIRVVPVKTVLPSERFHVSKIAAVEGLYRCVARYGYLDNIDMSDEQLVDDMIRELAEQRMGEIDDANCAVIQEELAVLEGCRQHETVHVIGHSILQSSRNNHNNWFARIVVNQIYRLLHSTCRSSESAFNIPSSRLLQVAMVYEA